MSGQASSPLSTQAIQIEQHGGPEVLRCVDIPLASPKVNEVQIKNYAIGLNFIDIYFRTGLYQAVLPHGLGFEGAGVVIAVGPNVTGFKVGDRVAYAQGPIGAYARMRNLPAVDLVKLPDEISFEVAAAIMLKGLTVHYLFYKTYQLKPGETILFHACAGGVGLLACQWAKALGVRLIGTASTPEKAALAKAHGAAEVILYQQENLVERLRDLTAGQMVPVVFDSVGKDTWLSSLDCLQPRGLMVSFGNSSGPITDVNLSILAQKGSLYVTRPTLATYLAKPGELAEAAKVLFDFVLDKKLTIHIENTYPLAQAGVAQEALAARKTRGATVLLP